MSNSTIIVLIAVAIVITIAVLDFLSRYKEEKKRRKSIEENKKLYVSSWSDWKPRYNLKHQGVYVFNIPFIPDKKEVFYLEDEYDKEANEFIRENIDYIENKLAAKGMSFIYLPDVKVPAEKEKEMISYSDPAGETSVEIHEGISGLKSNFLLDYMVFPKNRKLMKSSFAWFDGTVSLFNHKKTIYLFHYVSFDGSEAKSHPLEVLSEIIPEIGKERSLTGGACMIMEFPEESSADENFNNEEALSDEDRKALETIKQNLDRVRLHGISEAIISKYIKPYPKLSRMTITNDLRIILNDYKNTEIVMEPLVKTVYIFFLRHPEGILFKDLPDYRVEMEFIYREIKGRENDIERQLASSISPKISPNIEAVTDPTKNSINEKCSRIRNAFVSHFHDCIAQNYYIQGSKSFAKLITLPRDMVTWEDNGNGK